MAYPPDAVDVDGAEVAVETEFVPDEMDPINLVHRDMHLGNVMIGEFDPSEEEHRLCPIIKVGLQ